jgi:hypothetical protein
VLQLQEDVLEELEWDVLRGREALALHRLAFGGGELERGTDRVVGFRGDPHRPIVALQVNNARMSPAARSLFISVCEHNRDRGLAFLR